ncbi:MAG: PRC-barrel domain-containing protein [Aurantimonas endophytica]|uniref:PRC-barrel domain-containing protein n=1 Tax=Aurantimonas endophytica TaxID=1522175 RepID=UPI0030025FCC
MMRKLFATTALAGILATSAYAQDAAPTNTTPVAPDAAVTIDSDAAATAPAAGEHAGMAQGDDMQSLTEEQHLASDLIDMAIYQNAAADAESIGEIENFLVGNDGNVVAAVVETSANGESRTVAIPFDQITWSVGENNEPRAVLNVGVEQLAQAPEFVEPEDQAASAGTVAVDGAPATGTASAPVAGTEQTAATPPAAATTETAAATDGEYPSQVGADQFLADNLMSAEVRSGAGDDAEEIGTISDLVMASDGRVEAAVIGVGGFLGIGEKDVAVPFDQLQMTRDDDNDLVVATAMTREQLEQAPSFEVADDNATMAAGEPAATTGAATGTANQMTATDPAQTEVVAPGGSVAGAGTEMTQAPAGTAATTGTAAATGAATGAADTTTTASTGGEREGMTAVTDQSELTADNLLGASVYGPNEETVGDIADIALSPEGQVDAVIVDVGGFLGIGAKPVAVAMDNLQFMQDAGGSLYLYTQFTQEQLEAAPEYDADSYADNRETMRIQSGGTAGQPATAN